MFGLTVPISQSERQDEFDSVSTILSHSSITRPSSHRHTVVRKPLMKDSLEVSNGIFHLELSGDVEAKLTHTTCGDGGSVSSLASGMGCYSEDTGYSSDQEVASPDTDFARKPNLAERKKFITNKLDIFNNNLSRIANRTSRDLKTALLQVSSSATNELDKHHSDSRRSSNKLINHLCSHQPEISTQTLEHVDDDDGVFLGISDFSSSRTSSISCTSNRSTSSHNSSETCRNKTSMFVNDHRKVPTRQSVSSCSTCTARLRFGYKSVYVDIPLSQKCHTDQTLKVPAGSLCEQVLGIFPASRSQRDPTSRGHNTDVVIQRILPSGPASNKPGIAVGSILYSINDQRVTWDNMDTLLCGIQQLKKVKLTLKSPRPDTSLIDLETLVNMLTSDVDDHHSLGQAAVMYLSLDAVDPDSQDARNDGVVYSFPSQRNPLHQLSGLFFTLARLVKDIHSSSSIHNTTLSYDGQMIQVAYVEEGNDILVFALPGVCATVSQLNNVLLEFSRLLRVLFSSVECAFSNGQHWVFVDNLLHYLFKQMLPLSSPLPHLLSTAADVTESRSAVLRCHPFMKFSGHVPSVSLPDSIEANVDKILSEFESSTVPAMPGNLHGSRRQYIVLGSAYFHSGQLVSSHLSPTDLHDMYLYLRHLGMLDLTTRHSIAQFVAWREIHPTRFCQEIAEINSSFGYSEPNARWRCLIVGLKHGLLCSILETVGPTLICQSELPLDEFYIDLGKSCLLQLQTPKLLATLDLSVNEDSQSALAKSDYCATYVNTSGEKRTRLFSDGNKTRTSQRTVSLQPNRRTSTELGSFTGNVELDSTCRYPDGRQISPVDSDGPVNSCLTSNTTAFVTPTPILHRLSTNKNLSIYQYCFLDGMEGAVITGSDADSSGIFHSQIVQHFYQSCRQIHSYFVKHGGKEQNPSQYKDEDDDKCFEQITADPHLKVMKEHGILINFNPHQGEEGNGQRRPLEYWVIGRLIKHPSVREMYVCCQASASQSVVELAFKLSFGLLS